MKTIGLVPGSFKPYHVGHDKLIRIAASENDEVLVFSSTGDRAKRGEFPIYGADMQTVIDRFVVPSLPPNVDVISVPVPVSSVYEELQRAEEAGSEDVYTIYSDAEDILKYTQKALYKAAPNMFENEQIFTRGIERGKETPDISGAKMRIYLQNGDVDKFTEMLPPAIQKNNKEIINVLKNQVFENLLRTYMHLLLSE
jgi:cytidyltransferase-like protein